MPGEPADSTVDGGSPEVDPADRGDTPATGEAGRPFGLPRWVAASLPLVLLGVVLALFVFASPLSGVQSGAALPDVTITHATMPNDETVVLHVTNNGPEPVTVSQVLVDEAYWNFRVEGAGGDRTIGPLQSARVVVPYHWNEGWDLHTTLLLSDGTTFEHTIVAPSGTPGFSLDLLWTLALVGLFVGIIPVALGMLWYPYLSAVSDRWLHAVLLFAVGLLGFLAVDAGFEALELAEQVPGAYEGTALVVLGVLGALLLVQSVSAWRADRAEGAGAGDGLWVAYLVALGIGLHNLAEGLAIGSSFALGRVSLGAFLVVGFMLHNVTEGPAVVAPVARTERPADRHFVALGLLAGGPVVLGGWIGGLAYSPTVGALFLAVGVGAILQVGWEILGLVRDADEQSSSSPRSSSPREDAGGRVGTATNLLAFLAGFAVMYVTDLAVAL